MRINAFWIVAFVANILAYWVYAVMQKIRQSMGVNERPSAPPESDLSVSCARTCRLPLPAILFGLVIDSLFKAGDFFRCERGNATMVLGHITSLTGCLVKSRLI